MGPACLTRLTYTNQMNYSLVPKASRLGKLCKPMQKGHTLLMFSFFHLHIIPVGDGCYPH